MDAPQFGDRIIALNRFGLGARRGDNLRLGDPHGWLSDQLSRYDPAPAALEGLATRAELVTMFREYREEVVRLRDRRQTKSAAMEGSADPQASEARPEDGRMINPLRDAYIKAANARLTSALQTDTPFAERLVHFWSNHFAVSADKQPVVPLAGNYEFEAIRPHIMGSFADLLESAVLHPAMLLYLDQAQSMGPNSTLAERAAARRRRGQEGRPVGLNENLAREILELHTLGVRSGYSQADVTELARALTGWTFAGLRRGRLARMMDGAAGETNFVAAIHEPGARSILGKRYADGGADQALAVLRDLAHSPATARHVATKLARHFAADDPPEPMVARLERAFLESGGDLPTVYSALIASPEAWDGPHTKFRNPWDWSVASLRAAGVQRLPGRRGAAAVFQQLGQPVWRPGNPAGWGDTTQDWAGPGALMTRVEVAQQIANRMGNAIDPRDLAEEVMPGALGDETKRAIARAEKPSTGFAVLLASPEFLRR